jgi:hypothetical protein
MTNAVQIAVAALFIALTLVGCSSDERTPSAPTPPTVSPTPAPPPSPATTWLWGFVTADDTGVCIEDATIEVVRGQAQGQRVTQQTPCSVWDDGNGFVFKDLTPGVAMTLRASAPGWKAEEKTFVAGEQGSSRAVEIELKKL